MACLRYCCYRFRLSNLYTWRWFSLLSMSYRLWYHKKAINIIDQNFLLGAFHCGIFRWDITYSCQKFSGENSAISSFMFISFSYSLKTNFMIGVTLNHKKGSFHYYFIVMFWHKISLFLTIFILKIKYYK